MPSEFKITVKPAMGTFPPDSFTDLLQKCIEYPGLDLRYWHTVVDVHVADDGTSAEFTIHSESQYPAPLGAALRLADRTPPAHIAAFDTDGNELHVGTHPNPLQAGQQVHVGDTLYQVVGTDWPDRDPEDGIARGEVDRQHVRLEEVPPPTDLPVLVETPEHERVPPSFDGPSHTVLIDGA